MVSHPLHDPEYQVLVRVLKALRNELGVTQVELARRLDVEQSLISKAERRERRLDVVELRRVCIALGIQLSDFVERFEHELSTSEIPKGSNRGRKK
jgi:transcriptional regulator with XRE-family HTH domain